MSSTWYKTGYGNQVDAVEVERFTDKSVWVKRFRYNSPEPVVERKNRVTDYGNYYPTLQEAINEIRRLREAERDSAVRRVKDALDNIKKFEQAVAAGKIVRALTPQKSGDLRL